MYQPDLTQLIQKLKANLNGGAQDRLLLCEIHRQLMNYKDLSNNRVHVALLKITRPHKDAHSHRYDHKHDFMAVVQSKRNLLHAWDALQCYTDLSQHKDSSDYLLKINMLRHAHSLIQKGDFNLILTPDELDKMNNIVYQYANGKDYSDESYAQQVRTDYDNVLSLIDPLR